MKIDGACHCGAITFEAEVKPETVTICHCSDCQTMTGTAYRVSVPAPASTFRFTRGEPAVYVKMADSGKARAQGFCATCGTPVYSADVEAPQIYMLRWGMIRQRDQLKPVRQIWCQSAQDWAYDIGGLEKHPAQLKMG